MKKYKALMSLAIAVSLFISSLSGMVAFAETTIIDDGSGNLIEVEIDPETGDAILVGEDENEEDDNTDYEAEGTENPDAEEEEEEETTQNIHDVIEKAKLSGVDFVHMYDDSFEAVSGYLRKLGIFKDTDTDAELVITRGEFAEIVARIINAAGNGVQPAFRYEFKDVEEGVSYYDAVNTLCNYGFIEGDGKGYFHPDNEIKSAEAVIILMNMLGYYEIAHLRGEGDTGYRNLAINMQFTKEVPFNYSTTVTLGKAAKLIYHALHERVAESNTYKGGNITFSQSNDTLMYRYMGVYTIEGVVSANEYTAISKVSGKTEENTIKINDKVLEFNDESLNPQDYLGLYSRVYYKEDAGRDVAVFIEALKRHNEILKINAKDIEGFDKFTKTISYKNGEKIEQEKLLMDTAIIFNSAAVEGNINENYFTPEAGQLVFIDNDSDNKFDILIIDSYSTFVAKGKIANLEGTLYDNHGVHQGLSLAEKSVEIYKNNVKADITAIESGNVLFVATEKVKYEKTEGASPVTYQTPDSSSEYIRILASGYEFKGVLGEASDEYVYIDSVEYEYSNGFYVASASGSSKASASTRLNSSVSGVLDLNGDIAWITRGADEAVKYGYIVKAGEGEKGSDNHRIKLYSQDDEMITVDFANKVKLYKLWDDSAINSSTYYAKNVKGNAILTEYPELNVRQLIKFKLNKDGELAELYLPADDTARDYNNDIPALQEGIMYHSVTLDKANGHNMVFGANSIVEPLFQYSKQSSVGFVVPIPPAITEDTKDKEKVQEQINAYYAAGVDEDERYYRAYTASSSGRPIGHAETLTNKLIKLYDVDASIIGALVYEKKTTVLSGNESKSLGGTYIKAVVDSLRQVHDDTIDDYVTEISVWELGKLKKYKFAKSDIVSLGNKYNDDLNKVPITELAKGDVVLLHQDALGAIDGFRVGHRPMLVLGRVTANNPFVGYETMAVDSNPDDGNGDLSGKALTKSESYHPFDGGTRFVAGQITHMPKSTPFVNTNCGPLKRLTMFGSSSSVQILIYDVQADTITPSITSSKNPTFANCQVGDYVFWFQNERYPATVLVVRNYR